MPSYGQLTFLQNEKNKKDHGGKVSMPSYGQLTFLRGENQILLTQLLVSMPSYGQLTFLRSTDRDTEKNTTGVNALVRATYISTAMRTIIRIAK